MIVVADEALPPSAIFGFEINDTHLFHIYTHAVMQHCHDVPLTTTTTMMMMMIVFMAFVMASISIHVPFISVCNTFHLVFQHVPTSKQSTTPLPLFQLPTAVGSNVPTFRVIPTRSNPDPTRTQTVRAMLSTRTRTNTEETDLRVVISSYHMHFPRHIALFLGIFGV